MIRTTIKKTHKTKPTGALGVARALIDSDKNTEGPARKPAGPFHLEHRKMSSTDRDRP